jgi:hypothetical protein
MSDETNAVLALKNAWTGAVAAATHVQELNAAVQALAPDTPLDKLDLERYHQIVLADANAVQALRGLIEQLRARFAPAT